MKTRNAEFLLGGVIIARASSLLFSKLSMRLLGPFTLMGLRFSIAFAVLLLLFLKRFRDIRLKTILRGMVIGGIFFATMGFELSGLKLNGSSSVTSFLENTAIVWVPLMEAVILHRMPGRKVVLSACLALLGVGLLTLGSSRSGFCFGTGELLCLTASLLYAAAILLTARLSREDDSLLLGILQVGFIGLFSIITAVLVETPCLPQSTSQWMSILYLALVCSCFGFTLQPVAQRYVNVERAGLFCALNPLTAAVLGTAFLQEQLGVLGILGGLLILSSILIQGTKPQSASVQLNNSKASEQITPMPPLSLNQ